MKYNLIIDWLLFLVVNLGDICIFLFLIFFPNSLVIKFYYVYNQDKMFIRNKNKTEHRWVIVLVLPTLKHIGWILYLHRSIDLPYDKLTLNFHKSEFPTF